MDVIPVCVKEEITYVFPGTLFSRPRSEELNWKTVRLRPASTVLQSFIEPPSQVISAFLIHDALSFNRIVRASNFLLRRVPSPFPGVEPDTADRVNVSRTSNLVMTKDPGLKENANSVSAAIGYLTSKSIEYALQLMSEFRRDQCVLWRRVDTEVLSRRNRHSKIAAAT